MPLTQTIPKTQIDRIGQYIGQVRVYKGISWNFSPRACALRLTSAG